MHVPATGLLEIQTVSRTKGGVTSARDWSALSTRYYYLPISNRHDVKRHWTMAPHIMMSKGQTDSSAV